MATEGGRGTPPPHRHHTAHATWQVRTPDLQSDVTAQLDALRECNQTLYAEPLRLRNLPAAEILAYFGRCWRGTWRDFVPNAMPYVCVRAWMAAGFRPHQFMLVRQHKLRAARSHQLLAALSNFTGLHYNQKVALAPCTPRARAHGTRMLHDATRMPHACHTHGHMRTCSDMWAAHTAVGGGRPGFGDARKAASDLRRRGRVREPARLRERMAHPLLQPARVRGRLRVADQSDMLLTPDRPAGAVQRGRQRVERPQALRL